MVSCCFAVFGYLRNAWRALGIVLTFAVSYLLSDWAAFSVELNSPFLNDRERGNVSGQALFVGELTGASARFVDLFPGEHNAAGVALAAEPDLPAVGAASMNTNDSAFADQQTTA